MRLLPRSADRFFKPSRIYSVVRNALSSWRSFKPTTDQRTTGSPLHAQRNVLLEQLEPRLLLSADLSYADNGNANTDLKLTYDSASAEYRLVTAASTIVSVAAAADAADGGVVITGTAGNDT